MYLKMLDLIYLKSRFFRRSEESAVDTYNGGSFNGYSWSQTIQDLDIQV